jgi:hypothetical protein
MTLRSTGEYGDHMSYFFSGIWTLPFALHLTCGTSRGTTPLSNGARLGACGGSGGREAGRVARVVIADVAHHVT